MTSADCDFLPMVDKENADKNIILENGFSINLGTVCSTASKILDISSLTDGNETVNKMSDKNYILTYPLQEITEGIFTQQTDYQSIQDNREFLNETCEDNTNQAQQETIAIDDDEDTNDSDILSVHSLNFDKSDETNDSYKASGIKYKRICLEHSCDLCSRSFEFKRDLCLHIKKIHKINPYLRIHRCKLCRRTFRSLSSFNNHVNTHDEDKYQKQCPICKVTYNVYCFNLHIITHENNRCFPCQVCGKMHTSKEERMEHWKTHSEELPFHCHICYRRFPKQQYLTMHLKSLCMKINSNFTSKDTNQIV